VTANVTSRYKYIATKVGTVQDLGTAGGTADSTVVSS